MIIACECLDGPLGRKLIGFYGFVEPGPENPTDLHFSWLCEAVPTVREIARRKGNEPGPVPPKFQRYLDLMANLETEELEAIVLDKDENVWERLLAHEFLMDEYDSEELIVIRKWQHAKLTNIDAKQTRRMASEMN